MPYTRAVTSLIYAGVQQRNVNASMKPHVLSKERFLCCIISDVALHWPRFAGVAGAQTRSLLSGAQVNIGCLHSIEFSSPLSWKICKLLKAMW